MTFGSLLKRASLFHTGESQLTAGKSSRNVPRIVAFTVHVAAWFGWLLVSAWMAAALASALTGLGSVDVAAPPRLVAVATVLTLAGLTLAGFVGTLTVNRGRHVGRSVLGPSIAALGVGFLLAVLWLSGENRSAAATAVWILPRWLAVVAAVLCGQAIALLLGSQARGRNGGAGIGSGTALRDD